MKIELSAEHIEIIRHLIDCRVESLQGRDDPADAHFRRRLVRLHNILSVHVEGPGDGESLPQQALDSWDEYPGLGIHPMEWLRGHATYMPRDSTAVQYVQEIRFQYRVGYRGLANTETVEAGNILHELERHVIPLLPREVREEIRKL